MCAEHIRILSSGKNQGYGNELYGEVDMRSRFDEIKKIAPTERVMRLRKAVLDAKTNSLQRKSGCGDEKLSGNRGNALY